MIAATVILPTHDHADTLTRAVASVQAQTLADFELFVLGDGAPDRTRELMADIVRADERVRWFDCPKGERHGELHRHAALQEARGDVVCYMSDDDLWLPHHLQILTDALATVDFAHTVQIDVMPDGELATYGYDLTDPVARQRLLGEAFNFLGLSVAGHTLAAYRRLPHGWRPAPPGLWTDLHMWRQFLAQPWCRARTVWCPSALHFANGPRRDWPAQRRLAELDMWAKRAAETGFADWLAVEVDRQRSQVVSRGDATIAALHSQLAEQQQAMNRLRDELQARERDLAAASATIDEAHARLTRLEHDRDWLVAELAAERAACERQLAALAAQANDQDRLRHELAWRTAQLDAIYRSRWWRLADLYWRARRGLSRRRGSHTRA